MKLNPTKAYYNSSVFVSEDDGCVCVWLGATDKQQQKSNWNLYESSEWVQVYSTHRHEPQRRLNVRIYDRAHTHQH